MFNFNSQQHTADLVQYLQNQGVSEEQIVNQLINYQNETHSPLYLRILIGIGAFITSLFIILFIAILGFSGINEKVIMLIFSLIFIGGAFALMALANHNLPHSLSHDFFEQLSFYFMVIGKLLFVFAFSQLINLSETLGISLALLIILVMTYPIYQLSIDRFLTCLAFLFSIFYLLIFQYQTDFYANDISKTLFFYLFFILQLGLVGYLLLNSRIKHSLTPIAYAIVFSLTIQLLFLVTQTLFWGWRAKININSDMTTLLLCAALVALVIYLAKSNKLSAEPIIASIIGILVLGLISASGILFVILLLLIGYRKHDRLLIVLAGLLLPLFLILYYYGLEATLLIKSSILIGSGVALLVARFYIKLRGWDDDKDKGKNREKNNA